MAKPDPIPQFIEIKPRPQQAIETSAAATGEPDWVDQFLLDREVTVNTKKAYRRHLRQFHGWSKYKHWAEVTENDITHYKNYLKTKPGKFEKIGLAPASINQALAALQSFFKWLAVRRYISFNPTLSIEHVTSDPPRPKELEIKTVHQLDEGLSYRGHLCPRDTAVLWVLKHGLRGTEVSNLNIQDYTAEGVQVAGAKWGSDGLVPLCADARNSLDSYLGWCLRQEFDMSASGPLFKSQSNRNYGQRMSYRAIYNLVKDLAAISEIEESIHPHRLRHTFGTQMILEDVPPEFARKLMRIKSAQAFDRYTKRAVERKASESFQQVAKHSKSGLFSAARQDETQD